jgi:hypothetical protein
MTFPQTCGDLSPSPPCALEPDAAPVASNLGALRRTLAAALVFALASAGACAAGAYDPDSLATAQRDRAGQICADVMRLSPGEEHYDSCVDTLSDSARSLGRGQALRAARGICLDRGLTPGSASWGECELRVADGRSDAASYPMSSLGRMDGPAGAKSYFYASPHDVHRREALACARLGFDPADGAFASCVSGLQAAMFAADNPAQ